MINLRVLFGIIKHDIQGYVQSYKSACDICSRFPDVDPSNFAAIQDKAWEEATAELQAEVDKGDGLILRSTFATPAGDKN